MFEWLGPFGNALILLVTLFILDRSSDLAVENAVRVADITGLGKTVVGFILVAMTTTLPELSVSVLVAVGLEDVGVAVGNALGSNIVNICLILGLTFLIVSLIRKRGAHLEVKEEVETLYFGLFMASMVPLILIYVGYVSRIVGCSLIALFIYNLYRVSRKRRIENADAQDGRDDKLARHVLLTIIGVFILIVSASIFVNSASYIAEYMGIPKVVIGATIVAFGTSLPEFANSLKSSLKGHAELALGNIVGSCFMNVTLILGTALIGQNFRVNMAAFTGLAVYALISCLLLWYFISSKRISWKEGAILLSLYLIFLVEILGGYRE
ncbi:MAG: sodium:calcium antiporter [Nitrososphaerota archaeon]|nr:sodium:calcium antiporter [Candidatus Bathyarchaeota archaeon]MDW8049402.1 sodium:calcium antiporter [Nitrososphaerota archaeon]